MERSAAPPPQSTAPKALKVLPMTTCHSFKQGDVSSMRNKLDQFDAGFSHEITTANLALYPEEINALDEATAFLAKAATSPATASESPLTFSHIGNILHVLERWPSSQRFPVIDILRLISGYCPSAYAEPTQASQFFGALFKAAEWDDSWEPPIPRPRELNRHIALRALANGVQDGTVGSEDWLSPLLDQVAKVPYSALNKVQRTALSTLLFNISCVRLKGSLSPAAAASHLSLIARILAEEKDDGETVYRGLVALGNVTYCETRGGASLPEAQAGEVRRLVAGSAAKFPDERFRNIKDDITGLL